MIHILCGVYCLGLVALIGYGIYLDATSVNQGDSQ
jgi:hypothetical protein